MLTSDPQFEPETDPSEICGYSIERILTPSQSYLALGPGGREVVLKKADADCLFNGKLHPSIHERLSRVRELAHPGVANLHGVVREGADAYLIWEFVPGRTLDEYLADPARTPRDLLVLARELILSVDSLHMQGIVHGAITGANVIVLPDNSLRLTHVSPLLYTDMDVDVESVVGLLQEAVERRGGQASPLGLLLADAAGQKPGLRALGAKVAAMLESRQSGTTEVLEEERHIRRRAILGALLVAVLGLALGYGVWRAMDSGTERLSHWIPFAPSAK